MISCIYIVESGSTRKMISLFDPQSAHILVRYPITSFRVMKNSKMTRSVTLSDYRAV